MLNEEESPIGCELEKVSTNRKSYPTLTGWGSDWQLRQAPRVEYVQLPREPTC
jgi:hypothetical protein